MDGTSWTVIALNASEVPAQAHIELKFTGSRLTGNSGCNTFTTDYRQQGSAIQIGELATTRVACAAPVSTREQALYSTLPTIVTLAVSSDRLQLLDAAGVVHVVMTRRVDAPVQAPPIRP